MDKKVFKRQKKINVTAIILKAVLITAVISILIIAIVKQMIHPKTYSLGDILLFVLISICAVVGSVVLLNSGKKDVVTKIYDTDSFTIEAVKLMLQKKLPLYASVFINLKNFKHINRLMGATGGDIALYQYAKQIKDFLVKGEIVARLGGDNFIVLVYKHHLDGLVELLRNLTVKIPMDNKIEDVRLYTRAGIYTLSNRDTVSELFNSPSVALNYAKTSGSDDFVWFQKYMLEQVYEEKEIAYQFMTAVQNKDFKVYYQPKVDVETGKITGGEALVRWERDGKIYLPKTFIPSLEKSGLIVDLDFYVLEQVCKDLITWQENGVKVVPISSNFSKTHLSDKNFVHRIMSTICQSKVDSHLIQVEITESAGVNCDLLKSFFQQLHVSGIRTLIDDFGAGGFSWSMLKDSNVDAIKLDRCLIEGIEVNGGANDDSLLVRNIIHACCDLKKEAICEGVENVAQRNMLMDMRCKTIQGYVYDEPLPATMFERILERGQYSDF